MTVATSQRRQQDLVLKMTTTHIIPLLIVTVAMAELCSSLEMISVDVPRYPAVRGRALLVCNYDLGKDRLYSVKWYKDQNEFYRFVPKDNPPSQVFNVPWISVDKHQSNNRVVALRDLTLGATGVYTCEASSEAPRFKTISGAGSMQVLDLPDSRPLITGANLRGYRVEDWLDVNCTSPKSKPPALLKWYINNEKVDPSYVSAIPPMTEPGGLYTARLRLRFKLKRQHFIQGHVSIKCTAMIYTEYFESSELHLPGLGLGEKALESRRTNDGQRTIPQFSLMFLASYVIVVVTISALNHQI